MTDTFVFAAPDLTAGGFATPDLPGAPPVLRDHLLVPYLAGRDQLHRVSGRADTPSTNV